MSLQKLLLEKQLTVSAAESCTGGLIAKLLTDEGGASAYFEMGVVTYSNAAKVRLLGVSQSTLDTYGAVSMQTAAEMCEGMRKVSGADIAIAVTGIAGPSGGTADKPIGLVYAGVSGSYGTRVERLMLTGTRADIRCQAAQKALQIAHDYIVDNFG